MGTKTFVELCQRLEEKFGDRFTPPKLLIDMAAKGETFYGRFPPKKKRSVSFLSKKGRIIDPAFLFFEQRRQSRGLEQTFSFECGLHIRTRATRAL